VIIISITLFMTGCCMEEFPKVWNDCPDKNKPKIIINGDNPLTLTVGTSYNELGATVLIKKMERLK